MILTIAYIEEKFDLYNQLYFNGELMTPNFEITNRKNQLGCLQGKYLYHNGRISYTLKVSRYYDRTEKQYDNTIIHEMIHLFIAQNNIIDNGSHGRRFKAECARINKDGWNLSRTTDTSGWKLSDEAKKKENRKCNSTYNIIVYKEKGNGTQFFLKVSKPNVNMYMNYFKNRCNYECKHFVSNDSIFAYLPNCTKRIRGRRIYENDKTNVFAKYMI